MIHRCEKCRAPVGRLGWARALTRRDADQLAKEMARELQRVTPGAPMKECMDVAQRSILMKRPTLLVTCEKCGHKWVE